MFNPIKTFKMFFDFVIEVLGIRTIMLFMLTIWVTLPLIVFMQDSSLGASLYIGFCFFVALISFNKKAYKDKKTREG